MASNFIELIKLKATAHLETISAPDASTYNGYVYVLGTRASTGVYSVSAPAAVTDEGMVIVLHEDLGYAAETVNMNSITFASGDLLRAYVPELGDKIGIPVANVLATSALAVGKVVVPDAGNAKMECLASLAGSEVLAWEIERLYTKNSISMVQLRCIRTQK